MHIKSKKLSLCFKFKIFIYNWTAPSERVIWDKFMEQQKHQHQSTTPNQLFLVQISGRFIAHFNWVVVYSFLFSPLLHMYLEINIGEFLKKEYHIYQFFLWYTLYLNLLNRQQFIFIFRSVKIILCMPYDVLCVCFSCLEQDY